ncbi:MAG: hypothetical protein JKY26_06475 [Pseudomonas sp.]|nr:hypothetical protein [Pseudomonas sp.]
MSDIKVMAAQAALQKMLTDGYLCICTIDKITRMLSIVADREAYDVLRTLHCVHFDQMQPELLEQIPVLIMRVLDSPRMDTSRINLVSDGKHIRLVKH